MKPTTARDEAGDEARGEAAHAATRHHVKKATPLRFRGNPVYAQLPQGLQWQLAHHKIVVVSLYNPGSNVDAISVAEAHAGAIDANAGFLLVSVLDNKVAGLLTALLPGGDCCPIPACSSIAHPATSLLRLDGFADRASVAQAATNALHGETGPAPRDGDASSVVAPVAAPRRPPHPVTPVEAAEGRELFLRHAKKDGRSVAVLRAVDYGTSCVVEAEVYPVGSHETVQPGPTPSPTPRRRPPS